MKRIVVIILVACLILVGAYAWLVTTWSYSTGDRAGWLQKFSHKGWVCKTWEGELAMSAVPGSVPDRFYFTVRDDALAAQLEQAVGQRLRLHYGQHRGIPGTCLGETQYWVDSFVAAPDSALAPSSTPSPTALPRSTSSSTPSTTEQPPSAPASSY